MKVSQVRAISRTIIPHLPEAFVQKGFILYASPVGHVLRGFCFEDSGFDRSVFYVCAFFQPMYIPVSFVVLNFGIRLHGESGQQWSLNDPHVTTPILRAMKAEGIPFLSGVEDPLALARVIADLGGDDPAPHHLEAIAYSLALGGHSAEASSALRNLIDSLDPSIAWQSDMLERARDLKRRLDLGPEEAKTILCQWESETLANLGLQSGTVGQPPG